MQEFKNTIKIDLQRENNKKEMVLFRMGHSHKVQMNMLFLENNRNLLPFELEEWVLLERSFYHDLDKFSTNFVNNYFNLFVLEKQGCKNINEDFKKAHYEINRHHIPYHIKNNTLMTDLDVCEMCSDLDAVTFITKKENNYWFENVILKNQHVLTDSQIEDIRYILKLLRENREFIHN